MERRPAPQLGARVEQWSFTDARGDSFVGLYRAASAAAGRSSWTVVLLGGLQTGERATLALPESLPANVLAIDWPWRRKRRMRTVEFLIAIPAIRRALFATPAVLALGMDAAASQPEIDSTRIALLGASLGVPPAVAALELSSRPRALVLLHGGADLRSMLEHALRRAGEPTIPAGAAAALGARLLQPLEPSLHASLARSMPVLVVNARGDEQIPPRSIAALHAALPAAEIRWESGAHMRPGDRNVIAGTAAEVATWLAALPCGPNDGATPSSSARESGGVEGR